MVEKYTPRVTESIDISENSEAIVPRRERMVNALRRRRQNSIVPIETIDNLIEAVRILGFERATIPKR
jgi:hypothetical protein